MHRVSTSTGWHFTFVLCCHSNETRALIANLPNSACTTRGHSYHSPKLHPFPCSSVGMRWGRDRHTDMQMCVINIHFASSTTHTKCKYTTTTTTTILLPFLLDHPGETVPEENFWTLWCQGRLTESDTPTIRLGTTPSGLTSAHLHHPPFLQAGCRQPPVSKHWNGNPALEIKWWITDSRVFKKLRSPSISSTGFRVRPFISCLRIAFSSFLIFLCSRVMTMLMSIFFFFFNGSALTELDTYLQVTTVESINGNHIMTINIRSSAVSMWQSNFSSSK